jgi:hypothetical protein
MGIEFLIASIEKDIERIRSNNRHTYFAMSQDITETEAEKVRSHFSSLNYDVEVKMCPRKKWDIIIKF